jgi:hypothetical protein
VTELKAGQDFRRPELRREVFLRFYAWSVKYKSFPGGVHYALPYLADALELDLEQRYWLAWLNANTQNPVTSLLLLQAAPRLRDWRAAVDFWRAHYKLLDWDTDRRYHKARFEDALTGYASATDCSCTLPQHVYYRVGYEWGAWWERAYALPTMGRLSTWSYLEYLRILLGPALVPDADTLMLEDVQGSRSHRNGLALVLGHDHLIVDKQLGGTPGVSDVIYDRDVLTYLGQEAHALYGEAQQRCQVGAADLLSLESALCTYKSWHKPNRRYPGVYNDMLYNRLVSAENRWGHRFGVLWDARRAALPQRLRLEDQPYDPGLSPVKQNWYRTTGQVISMTEDWPCFQNDFERKVAEHEFGRRYRPMI